MEKRVGYILGGTVLEVFVAVALLVTATATRAAPLQAAPTPDPKASQLCIDCHRAQMPKVVEQWEKSEHAESGGVACLDCHAAEEDDWDATEHYGNATIAPPIRRLRTANRVTNRRSPSSIAASMRRWP